MQLFRFFTLLLVAVNAIAQSEPSYLSTLLDRAETQGLSQTNSWHALIYYRASTLTGAVTSEVDDDGFFLAEDGKSSPEAELNATIRGLFDQHLDDQNPQCRFPARTHWLKQQLSIDTSRLPAPDCPSFEQWFEKLNPGGASLIFPAAYLDSPSSMFGHTLLRIDQKNQTLDNEILAYAITYAAQKKEDESELAFIYKGLVGGYPGDTTVLPYYIKLKEYRDIESRDIWEYRLNLTAAEADQLARHIWEMENVNIDYFFFTQNCSYRILGMLDVLRPQQRMLEEFNLYAIPIDTVRLAEKRGWIDSSRYRPSVVTKFNHQLSQLSEAEREHVLSLVPIFNPVDLERLDHLPSESKNRILDVAYQYSRLAPLPREQAAPTSYQLLRARQASEGKSTLVDVPTPKYRDDEGHLSSRIRVQAGERDDKRFVEFQLRPAYHDLTDPALGYPIGSELKFLEMTVRHYEDDGLELKDLTAIGIQSIKPRTDFFQSTSWAVALGASRVTSGDDSVLTPNIEGQFGPAYRVGKVLTYALVGGESQISSKLVKGYDIRARANMGLLWRTDNGQGLLEYFFSDSVINGQHAEQRLAFRQVFNLTQNWAININVQRERQNGSYVSEYGAGFLFYFLDIYDLW
ncbi:MAG: DUF4105 domain-containing protein [Gammaproteobacteria bacterium]|nr:DUF4105 domain-containing protein [Gammaproteobacteria bacterium]